MKTLHRWLLVPILLLTLLLTAASSSFPADAAQMPDLGPAPDLPADYAPTIAPANPDAFNPVDVTDRAAVVAHFNANYIASNPAIQWTGNHAACNQGDTSAAFKNAVIDQVNFFRRMAGIQDVVLAGATDNLGAQKAALLMSVNQDLDHFPPSTWTCYAEMAAADPKGSDYAGRSNLAMGTDGAESINGYIMDPGANNTFVGHRGWIFTPQLTEIGTGDVPGGNGVSTANALYVFGAQSATRQTRDKIGGYEVVAWPPPGYVPYQVVYPRWSFEHPNADFTNATVTMAKVSCPGAQPMIGAIQNRGSRLVWIPSPAGFDTNGWGNHAKPDADTAYTVTIENATVNGTPVTFEYQVIVIDPAAPAPAPMTWDGSESSEWMQCQNWSTNRTPLPIDDITIPAGGPAPVVVNGWGSAVQVHDLTVADGASLSITGSNLNVYGDWTELGSGHTTATGGTVTFAGNGAQSVTLGAQSILPDVVVDNGAAVTLNGTGTIDGNLTLLAGGSLAADNLHIAGNWDDRNVGNGFVPGMGTVIFDGTVQTVNKVTTETLVSEDFNANIGNECSFALPTGWTRQQDADPGFLWCGTGDPNTPGMAVRWASTADGWLFTPALTLTAGVAYQLDYKTVLAFAGGDTYTVYLARAATSATMLATAPIYGPVTGSTTLQNATVPFAVPADGTYYIGFRSQGNSYAAIDDVVVKGQGRASFNNVTVAEGATTFLKDVGVAGDLTVAVGATATFQADTVTVEGSVVNHGAMQQRRTVADSTATRFLHIQNGAGSALKYAGVDITPNAAGLGETWVKIQGNQGMCNSGDELIHRCFDIAPATAQAATVRFWYLNSERGGQSVDQVNAFHWTGTAWDALTPAITPRGADGVYEWVEAVNVTAYSPFGLGMGAPTGPPVAEMDLSGNGAPIVSGDTTPDPADHTDFGMAEVAKVTVARTFTITNRAATDLFLSGTPLVELSGSGATHFQVISQPTATVSGGNTTPFQIRFDPTALGLHQATVTIPNNDGDENPYVFTIQGWGAQPTFLPAIVR